MAKKRKISSKLSMAKIAKEIQALFVKHLGKKIYIKEIKVMLVYLLDNYSIVSYEKNTLTIQTEDIYRENEENIGPFAIVLDIKKLFEDYDYLNDENFGSGLKLKGATELHPHLCSSHICTGGGFYALKKCIKDGRIDDFVDIVQQVLRT